MEDLPEELKALKKFHGHLGPFVVVGYKMGMIARERLHGKLKAVSYTGQKPPLSCIVDGVQFSSSCTLGKGNIVVMESGDAKVQFLDDKHLMEIELIDELREKLEKTMTNQNEEELATEIFHQRPSEIFHITIVERSPQTMRVKLK
ncbi:MAG: formylmethanofuran dehydrogenase subunit E family protein [Methanomassiliicoccales archaeon]